MWSFFWLQSCYRRDKGPVHFTICSFLVFIGVVFGQVLKICHLLGHDDDENPEARGGGARKADFMPEAELPGASLLC